MRKLLGGKRWSARSRTLGSEQLEPRHLLAAMPLISEFMADNESTLQDDDDDYSDWIELYNSGDSAADLDGYFLTDDASDLTKWRLPQLTLGAGEFLTVFASGKDRDDDPDALHTNFALSAGGEYLALVDPAGNVVHEFNPFPPQLPDISYGISSDIATSVVIDEGVQAKYLVPSDASLEDQWNQTDFSDASWPMGPTAIGYDTGETEVALYHEVVLSHNPVGYWRMQGASGTTATNLGTLGSSLDGTYNGGPMLGVQGPGAGEELFGLGGDNVSAALDGTDDAIQTSNPALSGVGQFTMMGFIRPGNFTATRVGLFGQNDAVEFGFISPNTLQVWTPSGGSLDVAYTLPRNAWHHVAVVGTGTNLIMYLDGVEVGRGGAATSSYGTSNFNFNIGGGGIFDATGNFFQGGVDEVAVFTTALSAGDIDEIYTAAVGEEEPTGELPVPSSHWTFDANNANDVTPRANNGFAVGNPSYVDSPRGRAINLSGASDFVVVSSSLPNFAELRPTDNVAIAAWVQRNDATAGEIASLGDHYRLRINADGSVEFAFDNAVSGTGWLSVTSNPAVASERVDADSQWHHVVAQKTDTGLELWIDGVKSSITTNTTAAIDYAGLGNLLYIGQHGNGGGLNFNGLIDEVAIWDRVLTPENISELFAGPPAEGGGGGAFGSLIATDVQTAMFGNNSSLYVRIPFHVDNPTTYNQLTLDIKYDDGFVAYINGQEALRRLAPGEEEETVPYNARALGTRPDSDAVEFETIDLTDALGMLVVGENLLAIQLLNAESDNPDVLLLPVLEASTVTPNLESAGYLTHPTPDELNDPAAGELGPLVRNVTSNPGVITAADPIVVTATATETFAPVASMELVYRVMYGAEVPLPMSDDGTGSDAVAGDGIYTAVIPAGVAQPGQMVRWYVRATDTDAATGRAPEFLVRTGQNQDPEYYGTVIVDPTVDSNLAVLHWFVQPGTESAAGSRAGTRAALYYDGQFYDNVFVRQRGGSTANNPLGKTHFKFDFKGAQFQFDPNYQPVEEFNLNSTASDKAYVRQPLAFEVHDILGVPSSISFPLHVRRNDEFYGLYMFIEEPDDEMLEREGLDPDGALYKFYNEFLSTSGARKKTREDEGLSDLASFISNVNSLTGEALSNYLFDNVDLPTTLNYLVSTVIVHQNDNPHKNHFLYRDTEGTGEWLYIPWDHDLTFGSNWVGTSFSDVIYADVDRITFGPTPPHNLNFIAPSHPFVNTENFREWNNHWNRLMDALLNDERIREMYLRRLRSAMDQLLGSPDEPAEESWLNQRLDEYVALISDDVQLDRARWANPWPWGSNQTLQQAVNVIKNDYLAVRRVHLYETHSIDNLEPPEPVYFINEGAPLSWFAPGDNSLGTTWTALGFDDSGWATGQSGIGFENSTSDFDDVIRTEARPNQAAGGTSLLVRHEFEVADPDAFEELWLQVQYDDGFVLYINGQDVLRRSYFGGTPNFNSSAATSRPNNSALTFTNINLTAYKSLLVPGTNVLGFHVLNANASDPDMLLAPLLHDTNPVVPPTTAAGIPHEQIGNPPLVFDAEDYEAHPSSGNQDEEYIKIDNPTDQAVDISGWRITGGVEHTFKLGTVIPAGDSIYVSPNVPVFRARGTGPSGNQGLFVQGNYTGHLSTLGETLQLVGSDGELVDTLVIPPAPTDVQLYLRLTEINYNPLGSGDVTEFLELQNISSGASATTLDLSGVTLADGPSEPFVIPQGTMLSPGEYLVIAKDPQALRAAYPSVPADNVVGPYLGNLNNAGETVKLDDALGNTIVEINYNNGGLWSQRADEVGATLVLDDPAGTPIDQLGKPYRWRASTEMGGSPGAPHLGVVGVVINEVRSNSDDASGQTDAIELKNITSGPMNIGGWYLSDSATDLLKFQIPMDTILPPGGFIVFDESHFNPTPATPAPHHFALDGNDGDNLFLVESDGSGGVARFVDDVEFGGARNQQTMGRVPDGVGWFTPLARPTLECPNSSASVSSVVISEIQYNPGAPNSSALAVHALMTSDDLEYVELYNASDSAVDLLNWRLRGGVDMDFTETTTLAPGEVLVVVAFDPDDPANSNRRNAFLAHYQLDPSVRLVGGYNGHMSDSTDIVRLDSGNEVEEEPGTFAYVTQEEIRYDDRGAWPTTADGTGDSLQRGLTPWFGGSAAAWLARDPSPGSVDFTAAVPGDLDGDGIVDARDIDRLNDAIRQGTNNLGFDLNSSGVVDAQDASHLIVDILNALVGDANLDGFVDGMDFNRWNASKFLCGGWGQGDFNGDFIVDASDFNLWFANRFTSSAAPVAASRPVRSPLPVHPDAVDQVLADQARADREAEEAPGRKVGQEQDASARPLSDRVSVLREDGSRELRRLRAGGRQPNSRDGIGRLADNDRATNEQPGARREEALRYVREQLDRRHTRVDTLSSRNATDSDGDDERRHIHNLDAFLEQWGNRDEALVGRRRGT